MKSISRLIAAAVAASAIACTQAKVVLPTFYASNMVLQQKANMTIKGKANANSTVKFTPSWNNKAVTAKADAQGAFSVTFRVPDASFTPYTLTFTDGDGELVLSDILCGEVWLCSGQSNMEMPVRGWGHDFINNSAREVADADKYPMIRLLQVKMSGKQPQPVDDTEFNKVWEVCSSKTIGNFSAIGYLYGRELYEYLRVPIGLIQSAFGGSTAEAWVSLDNIRKFPDVKKTLDECEKCGFLTDSIFKTYKRRPQHTPTLLYNTMLHPLRVLPIKGVIWYQGCSNAWGCPYYTELMNTLIGSWRDLWGYKFPFYYVQLAGYQKQVTVQPESNYAKLRWDQWKSLSYERTGMATAIDIGNQHDIHPKNKQEIARRLLLVALNKTYGRKNIVCEAPAPASISLGDGKATIKFNGNIHVRNDSTAAGFIACDANNNYVEATAKLEDANTLSITAPGLGKIKDIRYNWAEYPIGNLYGPTNLPVLPFRTDDMTLKEAK